MYHPALACPRCGTAVEDAERCPRCKRAWCTRDGLPDFVQPGTVVGPDRWLNVVYDRLGQWHDPAVERLLPRVDDIDLPGLRRAIVDRLGELGPASELLDIACGTGQELQALAQQHPTARLSGVDLSPTMLSQGRAALAGNGIEAWLAYADAHALPFADDSFDGVVHVGAMNNFRDKSRALAEMLRVARPGATVVVVDEQLDPSRRHNLVQRAVFKSLTWYDADPRAPVHLLPDGVEHVELEQASRFYYLLSFRKPS